MFFRGVVNFAERNLAGSKAFSHASAPRDYMSLPTLTGSKVGTPCSRGCDYWCASRRDSCCDCLRNSCACDRLKGTFIRTYP